MNPIDWLWADTHFDHHNIITYCNRPPYHDQLMLDSWRAMVRPQDSILHLGDLMLPRPANKQLWLDTIRDLPGRKWLIRGNHDHRLRSIDLAHMGFELHQGQLIRVVLEGKVVIFSHRPYSGHLSFDLNLHGHIHNNKYPWWVGQTWKPERFVNLSVETTNYSPVRLSDVLASKAGSGPAQQGIHQRSSDPEEQRR